MRLWPLPLLVLAMLAPLASAEGTGTIHVTVCIEYDFTEDQGMRPIPDDECWMDTVEYAPVTAAGASSRTATADFHGVAVFPDIPAGEYTLGSDAPGFTVEDRVVHVEAGQRTHVVLKAQPTQSHVEGRLVDDDLSAVAGALLHFDGAPGSWNVTTDDDGAFEATVQTGYHHLRIAGSKHGGPLFVDGSPLHLMIVRDDGSITMPGQAVDQDGQPVPLAHINGWSRPPDHHGSSEPEMRDGYLVLSDPYLRGDFEATADEEGRFEVSLHPGHAHLMAWADGHREARQDFEVHEGAELVVVLQKLPDKDARVSGTVVDAATGQPVEDLSISISNRPMHEWACSIPADEEFERHHWHRGCDITTTVGGFAGAVMPGYSILEIWARGDCEYSCMDPYVRHVQTVVLEPGENTFRIELHRRPAPDAAVNGYVLDGVGEAVRHVSVDFHTDGSHGSARVDEFGSYRVMLRPGWHQVSVWAPGFYEWQGMVHAVAGKEVPFDIRLTEDPEWCCGNGTGVGGPYGHPPMPFMMERAVHVGEPIMLTATSDAGDDVASHASDADFVDLGGLDQGYDVAERKERGLADDAELSDARKGFHVPAVPAALVLLALVLVRRRW